MQETDCQPVIQEGVNRKCCRCDLILPLDQFELKKGRPFGRGYRCKACSRDRHAKVARVWKECPTCKTSFETNDRRQIYCSKLCYNTFDRSGNWKYYYNRMITPERSEYLCGADLLALHERQGGKCALTGVDLTCVMRQGYVPTNASLDRINAGEAYTLDNIQLVCCIVNTFRSNLTIEEYVGWCRKVVDHAR